MIHFLPCRVYFDLCHGSRHSPSHTIRVLSRTVVLTSNSVSNDQPPQAPHGARMALRALHAHDPFLPSVGDACRLAVFLTKAFGCEEATD
jgi:hypothetical protein